MFDLFLFKIGVVLAKVMETNAGPNFHIYQVVKSNKYSCAKKKNKQVADEFMTLFIWFLLLV